MVIVGVSSAVYKRPVCFLFLFSEDKENAGLTTTSLDIDACGTSYFDFFLYVSPLGSVVIILI